MKILRITLIALACITIAAAAKAPPSYSMKEVGVIPGTPFTGASGAYINALGDVVGTLGGSHAFLYHNGKTTDLGALLDPNANSHALFVNLQGAVVIETYVSTTVPNNAGNYGMFTGYVYQRGRFIPMPTNFPNDGSLNQITGFNDWGQIAGNYSDPVATNGSVSGFLMRPNGTIIKLPIIPIYQKCLNDLGQIVGMNRTLVHNSNEAFLYQPGGFLVDLGNFGGYSIPTAINSRGQVIGYSSTSRSSDYPLYAFLYSYGKLANLGSFPGAPPSGELYYFPVAFNDFDTVVGEISDLSSMFNVVFVQINGTMYDLNSLLPSGSGFVIGYASSINDFGQILVNGSYPTRDNYGHTVILTRTANR